jgi:hypothetical protein
VDEGRGKRGRGERGGLNVYGGLVDGEHGCDVPAKEAWDEMNMMREVGEED